MVKTANLGFPRIGANRELKKAVEAFWKGKIQQDSLQETAKEIRITNWQTQQAANLDYIPANDFSLYDQILDTICLVGAIPERYQHKSGNVSLETYFAMARGLQKEGLDVPAMEMTKWFDTNYHYIVPEFTQNQKFAISSDKIFKEFQEARNLEINVRPVLVGPLTLLCLGKEKGSNFDKFSLNDSLTKTYLEIFSRLAEAGVTDIQIDEPALVTDLAPEILALYEATYQKISSKLADLNIKLHLTSYFADLGASLETFFKIKADSYHLDLVRAPEQLEATLELLPEAASLSLGVIDGRNIWINDLENSLVTINKVIAKIGSERVIIAPSCSLLHSPVSLEPETNLDQDIKSWLAFATEKLAELNCLKEISNGGSENNEYYDNNRAALKARRSSNKVHNDAVKTRMANLTATDYERTSPYEVRAAKQRKTYNFPLLPTTTIGSFPQTNEVRKYRADFKRGDINENTYNEFIAAETISCLKRQEEIGIDVLVHGEFERNDMVEYFGENLDGFAFTKNGWVQSYGSRCVKPPIIFGDVSRNAPMTVEWSKFAQENTNKEVKGMLTGPITMLQWSFVRDDQPRETTCKQIALAIQDEVLDLEAAGIHIIQIDEPAIREGLPIRHDKWYEYLEWAVASYKLSQSKAQDATQIHTHMCYSEFNDIIDSIAAMDADVLSIETSRSQMELLDAFVDFKYPNEIGPGVYDIHSPRVPAKNEMKDLILKAVEVLPIERIWVNPDCGLKTRGWPEVESALKEMVNATKELRDELQSKASA